MFGPYAGMKPCKPIGHLLGLFMALLLFPGVCSAEQEAGLGAKEQRAMAGNYLVYVGTYTGAKSKGIYAFRMDSASGTLTPLGLAAETPNPSYLSVSPNQKYLFAANEVGSFKGKPAGSVSAFSIDKETGKLSALNTQSTMGPSPCHLVVDLEGRNVLVANYGGSVAVLPIQPGGQLGEATAFVEQHGKSILPERQSGPHAHCVTLTAENHEVFVCDLGLDKILTYQFDSNHGTLTANQPPFVELKPGAGPRHMTFRPDRNYAYSINELDSTISVLAHDAKKGALAALQTISTLPEGFQGKNYPAEIEVHRTGKFLYGSNRGHDSIVVFAIDSDKGTLTLVEHQATNGKTPRGFGIDPTGRFLLAANQDSNTIVVFAIDSTTGRLKNTGQILDVHSPVCVTFVPLAKAK
ncbi:MAG: pgl [Pedosphaera sp.]|nr:pgl [Pedosphaera sp.]